MNTNTRTHHATAPRTEISAMNRLKLARPLGALAVVGALSAVLSGGEAQAQRFGRFEHAPLPIVGTEGGPVLTSANIVPVYYAEDPLASDLAAYFAKLRRSSYLPLAVAQYGVSSLTVAAPIVIAGTPPGAMLDTDIATWITSEITAGALPPPDATTAYQIVYPSSTQVSQGGLYNFSSQTCSAFHFEAYDSSGNPIPFGVVPLCEGSVPGMTDLELDTLASAGNIANVVTNPDNLDSAAYGDPSWSGSAWGTLAGYELGLLCSILPGDGTTMPRDLGYLGPARLVERGRGEGGEPVPHVLVLAPRSRAVLQRRPYHRRGDGGGRGRRREGGSIVPATGGSITIPVHLFSDRAMGEWSLSAARAKRTPTGKPLRSSPSRSTTTAGGTETFGT